MWQQRVAKGGTNGGVQWGMASDGQNVYAAASDAHSIPGATVAHHGSKTGWRADRAARRRRQQSVVCRAHSLRD